MSANPVSRLPNAAQRTAVRRFAAECLLGISLLLTGSLAFAQETAEFLTIPVGARPVGMGGAFTAIADDINALAWNPGGLASLSSRELGGMHAAMVGNTSFEFFGYAQPLKHGTLGADFRTLNQGAIDGRDQNAHPTGTFSADDQAFDLGYGARFSERLSLGGAVRYIRSSIADTSADTYALDIGTLYALAPVGPGRPVVGLAVQNLGPGMRFLDERSPLPLTFASGIGYRLPEGLTLAIDYRRFPYSKTSEFSVGTELSVLPSFTLRSGFGASTGSPSGTSPLRNLSGGFGVRPFGCSLDYSITPFADIGFTHRFSLGVKF